MDEVTLVTLKYKKVPWPRGWDSSYISLCNLEEHKVAAVDVDPPETHAVYTERHAEIRTYVRHGETFYVAIDPDLRKIINLETSEREEMRADITRCRRKHTELLAERSRLQRSFWRRLKFLFQP